MQQNRRRFLHLSGAAALAAIAGCSSTGGNGNGNGNGNSNGDTTTTTDSGNGNGNGNGDGTASFDGWLDGTDNFDGTVVDATGESQVTIDVGASANGGSFGFAPPVVTVDPGTTVVWEWTGDGGVHNVVGENMDFRSGDPTGDAGNTFEQTFEDDATVKYYCNPHRQSGMKGVVVVGEGGEADDTDDGDTSDYGWEDATWDSYWYSLYNMSTNIAMSGNGVPFPLNEQMEELQSQRMPAMLEAADTDRPPINQPNLTFAAFTSGDPNLGFVLVLAVQHEHEHRDEWQRGSVPAQRADGTAAVTAHARDAGSRRHRPAADQPAQPDVRGVHRGRPELHPATGARRRHRTARRDDARVG